MRKSILASILLLLAAAAGGQELTKGNLVGTHLITVKLQPGVTLEQYADVYLHKVAPQWQKISGWRTYGLRRIRGEKAEGFAVLMVVPSEADRDRYYNADGTQSEAGKAAVAKLQPALAELDKLGTITADVYTDWLVY